VDGRAIRPESAGCNWGHHRAAFGAHRVPAKVCGCECLGGTVQRSDGARRCVRRIPCAAPGIATLPALSCRCHGDAVRMLGVPRLWICQMRVARHVLATPRRTAYGRSRGGRGYRRRPLSHPDHAVTQKPASGNFLWQFDCWNWLGMPVCS
jgi:hypothetical protein